MEKKARMEARATSLELEAEFAGGVLAQERPREPTEQAEMVRGRRVPNAASVFARHDVERVMPTILHVPMRAHVFRAARERGA